MAFKATVHTNKEVLTTPIAFVNLPTLAAFLTGVMGVNQQEGDASKLALVLQELPQLVERPVGVSGSLLLANPGPRAYALQVFDGNRPMRALGKVNQPPTNAVIHILLKPGLSPRKLFEPALGRLCPYGLQDVPAALIPPAPFFYLARALDHAIAGDNDIGDPHIHTDHIVYILLWLLFDITSSYQIELTLDIAEIRLAFLGLQQVFLVFPAGIGDLQATSRRPNRDKALVGIPSQDTLIVGESAFVGELAFPLLVKLIAISDLTDGSDNHLGRQSVVLSNVVIAKTMDIILLESLFVPGHAADGIASLVGFFQRIQQVLSFIRGTEQLDFGSQPHRTIVLYIFDQGYSATRLKPNHERLLPRLKAVGVRRFTFNTTKEGDHE